MGRSLDCVILFRGSRAAAAMAWLGKGALHAGGNALVLESATAFTALYLPAHKLILKQAGAQ